VLNFYDLERNIHIKTVLVMESVEGSSFVTVNNSKAKGSKQSAATDGTTYHLIVSTAAGNLIAYAVHMSAVHGNTYNFRCEAYLTVPINKIVVDNTSSSSSSSAGGEASNDASDSLSIANTITSMQYLSKSNSLLVMTADNAICEFDVK
jgi:hypothetical protein